MDIYIGTTSCAIHQKQDCMLLTTRHYPFLGYYEFLTHRNVMVDMPTHHDPLEKVPLDGVVSVVKRTG